MFVPFSPLSRVLLTNDSPVLHELHLIHTDLKPENILLVNNDYQIVQVPASSKVRVYVLVVGASGRTGKNILKGFVWSGKFVRFLVLRKVFEIALIISLFLSHSA